MWHADPAGANEISELRCADIKVRKGDNSLRAGIAAVTARLNDGRLKVMEGRCPNLLVEAGLYRYSSDPDNRDAETPVDDHNRALAALRYLVCRLDRRRVAVVQKAGAAGGGPTAAPPQGPPNWWQEMMREELWTRIC